MRKAHDNLMNKSSVYSSWHKEKSVGALHWAIFVMIAVLMAQTVAIKLEIHETEMLSAVIRSSGGGRGPVSASGMGGIADVPTDRIIVKFKENVGQSKRNEVLARNALRNPQTIRALGAQIYTVSEDDTAEEVVQRILASDRADIEYAEVDVLWDPAVVPNDPNWSAQWDKRKMRFPEAWDTTTGSSNIIVAIVDTGVDCTHPDLAPNCVAGWNIFNNNSDTSDIYGHGTPVAGVVGAVGNNSIGVAGGVWNSKIMPVRSSKDDGRAYTSDTAKAIIYAADNGAKVINNSYASCGSSSIVRDAAKYANSKGAVVVYSLGNSGGDTGVTTNPTECIGVTATNSSDALFSWSSYGINADVSAPGCTDSTTARGGGYRSFCGTSNSAPEVAGLVALMFSANPSLTPSEIRDHLYASAEDLGPAGWDKYFGWGRVDAFRAVERSVSNVRTPDTTPPSAPQGLSASATDSQVSLSWRASTDNVGVAGYEIFRNNQSYANTANNGFIDRSVSASTNYSYAVRAYDSAGNISSLSNQVSVSTPAQSMSISSYSVSKKSGTDATIVWNTNIPSNGFINYGTNKSSLNQTITSSASGTSHSVYMSGLNRKTAYYYQIVAVSSDGTQRILSPVSSFRTNPR